MEELFTGEGWLDNLLGELRAPSAWREKVRKRLKEKAGGGGGTWEKEWKRIDGLLGKGEVGAALEASMKSMRRAVEAIEELGEGDGRRLYRTFSPFLVRGSEIRRVLKPREDLEELARSRDDLDALTSLELINDARRLLASWGANSWGRELLDVITRLEADLDELSRIQVELRRVEEAEEEDFEAEMEVADHLASAATRFARDLFQLHLLNARNPEVSMRFRILWNNVRQMEEEGNVTSAAFEALQVFEEAMQTAGLGRSDLLEMVDMLYDLFSEPEDLRRSVNRLSVALRDRDVDIDPGEGREIIETLHTALQDMGLSLD